MKIVHTGDWHIGKALRGKSRAKEYRAILQELKQFLRKRQVDLLLVAGDIFDSFTPSAEAEDIVYNFFHDVAQMKIATIAIAGNHDSSFRFAAISSLMALAGITMVGFMESTSEGEVCITTKSGEQARIFPLPFVPERTFVRADDLLQEDISNITGIYSHQMGKIFQKFSQRCTPQTANIIIGHALMHGAKPCGSEKRLYLGDNYAVHPQEIPDNIDYVALGHIHLRQQIDAPSPVHYCGSPLQMDFGESATGKGFLFIDTREGSYCEPEFVELKSGKKLVTLEGSLDEVVTTLESTPKLTDSYLKLTVTSDDSVSGLPQQLKKRFPNAVDIRRRYSASKIEPTQQESEWLPKLYCEFYQRQHQSEISTATIDEFKALYQQCAKK